MAWPVLFSSNIKLTKLENLLLTLLQFQNSCKGNIEMSKLLASL